MTYSEKYDIFGIQWQPYYLQVDESPLLVRRVQYYAISILPIHSENSKCRIGVSEGLDKFRVLSPLEYSRPCWHMVIGLTEFLPLRVLSIQWVGLLFCAMDTIIANCQQIGTCYKIK